MGKPWLRISWRRSTFGPNRRRKRHGYCFDKTNCTIACGTLGRGIKGYFTIPPTLFYFPLIHYLSWRHCLSGILIGLSLGEFKLWDYLVSQRAEEKFTQIKQQIQLHLYKILLLWAKQNDFSQTWAQILWAAPWTFVKSVLPHFSYCWLSLMVAVHWGTRCSRQRNRQETRKPEC